MLPPRNVEILVADRYFLYLPLYLAQFNKPESNKQPFFGLVPPEYQVEVKATQFKDDKNDVGVFNQLMNARLGSSDIMFAVCDPNVLLQRPSKDALLAGSIVSSSAFWAIDHDVRDVRVLSDLSAFDRILCYEDKTTSHLIASRIVSRASHKLEIVPTTEEIDLLDKHPEGTLAISPEVLKIANYINGPLKRGERRAQIVLDLSTTKEFSNVLTTALFTRREVLEAYPDLVMAVLAALQSALLAIHAERDIVAECAHSAFNDTYHVKEAIALATTSNVFPETIQVRRDRWHRACEFYFSSKAIARGEPTGELSSAEERQAEELYQSAVLNPQLKAIVSRAISKGFQITQEQESPTLTRAMLIRKHGGFWWLLLVGGFAMGITFATPLPLGARLAMSMSWILMLIAGWSAASAIGFRELSAWAASFWLSFFGTWWAAHDMLVTKMSPLSHFIPGLVPDADLRNNLFGAALAFLTLIIGMKVGPPMMSSLRRSK